MGKAAELVKARKELEDIAKQLRNWAKKYSPKDGYVNVSNCFGCTSANVDPKDENHDYYDVFIRKDE